MEVDSAGLVTGEDLDSGCSIDFAVSSVAIYTMDQCLIRT